MYRRILYLQWCVDGACVQDNAAPKVPGQNALMD